MGAVLVKTKVHDAFMSGPEEAIDFFHGYTYSGHPVACAASHRHARGLQGGGAADARGRACALLAGGGPFAQGPAARHRHPQYRPDRRGRVRSDSRRAGQARAYAASSRPSIAASSSRATGDIIALSPPLIIEKKQIDQLIDILSRCPQDREGLRTVTSRMETIQNAIDGRKVTSSSRRMAPVYNPATGEQTAELPLSTAAEVESAVAAAKKAADELGHDAAAQARQADVPLQGACWSATPTRSRASSRASTARPTPMRRASSRAASTWSISPAASLIC